MQLFDNASIRTKSMIAPLVSGVIIVGMLALLYVSYGRLLEVSQAVDRAGDLSADARGAQIEATTVHADLYRAVSLRSQGADVKLIQEIGRDVGASLERVAATMQALRGNRLAEARTVARAADALTAYSTAARDTAAAVELDPFIAAMQMNDTEVQFRVFRKEANALVGNAAALSKHAGEQMNSTLVRAGFQIGVAGVLAVLLSIAAGLWLGGLVSHPIRRLTSIMTRLADGQSSIDVPGTERRDEVGAMSQAVEVFRDREKERSRLEAEAAGERAAKDRRQVAMNQHTEDFGVSIAGVMSALAGSADTMRGAAETMTQASRGVQAEASDTARDAARSSQDLVAVAGAVEQLTSSVGEISRQTTAAASVAREAVQRAEISQSTTEGLVQATGRIGDVVRLIADIASQTNLLALNATIEAARAGEAGKGFAVVAGEVKTLAAQTAKATAEISEQIAMVRGAAEQAVVAMNAIGGIIGKMDQVVAAISAAVEQQDATTREIAGSVQTVSDATRQGARAMEHVAEIAHGAGKVSADVLTGATEVGKQAATLHSEVEHFLLAVRDETG